MPRSTTRGLFGLLIMIGWLLAAASPALGQVSGPCSSTINGVEVERIDSINSPLELRSNDTLLVQGVDGSGTQTARVALRLGPVTIDSGTTTYGPLQSNFEASLDLNDVSPYGVGLFRVRGLTDNCQIQGWVRISGRIPFATLAGLAGAGLALGGIAGQLGAIWARRASARSTAAISGIATGTGGAVLGQEFGRLQLSYISIALSILAAAAIGYAIAGALSREGKHRRAERRADRRTEQAQARRQRPVEHERAASQPVHRSAAPSVTPAAPGHDASPNGGPYWCYVMAATDVFDLNDHTRIVANLQPGKWYLAKREVGGWVHVVATEGSEGWVTQSSVHRQG